VQKASTTIKPDVSGTASRQKKMCRQFKVNGRVQGVFFRASTRDVAVALNLTGHAINLQDGAVDVLACGASDAIDQLLEWLRHGPPMAAVASVEEIAVSCTNPDRFTIS
jgi:acylphosphatase